MSDFLKNKILNALLVGRKVQIKEKRVNQPCQKVCKVPCLFLAIMLALGA
jgi:hypothetical protein